MKTTTLLRLLAAALTLALFAAACGSDDDGGGAATDGSADGSGTTAAGGDGGDGDMEVVACGVDEVQGDLNIYNWAEYIDPEQLAAFETQYGVSVTMDVYDSNEAMQPIISAGNSGYDLIVPSDYMVGILIASGDIQPLNKDAIPNLTNLSEEFQGLSYDPDGTYSVPYQWGYTGLAVDTEVAGTDFPRSWSLVFDPEVADQYSGQISLLNDPRETLGAALKYLGYSLNTTSEEELNEAKDLVADASSRVTAFDTDQADELLTTGETAIAHGYSGDMFTQFQETDVPERYVFFVPEEGGTRWIDNMAIPQDAPDPCTAHTFINWLLDGEQGAALSNWNYYSTPNAAAIDGLDPELADFVTSPDVVPGGVDGLEEIKDTGEFEINYSDAFIQAKG
ncbi:MAG: spermidine/putrescine ABC transporter substrate-binding protein [Acidimicrobiia bacterium]|nr:spermidine/putrescine ABC transporter substrate-binding protein [Acidimicrobiia bacterium]MDH5238148.1 spermidine/putrescine ABC transporter substrate-binding protein [Acidimicrobiia bacterium]